MTAVARLLIKQYPLLIGDLLTSNRPAPGTEIPLPICDVVYGQTVDDTGPAGLRQKIAIVADNIVIGWAGVHKTAHGLIDELRQRCESEQFNSEMVKEYLWRQRPSVWNDIGVVGCVLDSEVGNLQSFGCKCSTIHSPVLGEIGLLGSGTAEFEKYLQTVTEIPVAPQDPENQCLQAAACGLALAGNFFTMEQHHAENLTQKFGGGYEIAVLSNDKFVKVGDLLYVFWSATVNQRDKSVKLRNFPYCAFRYEYYGDLLVIRGVGIHEDEGTVQADERVFPVAPAYRYLTAKERENRRAPPLTAGWICNYVQIRLEPQSKMDILTSAGWATQPPWVDFEEHEGRVRKLTIAPNFRPSIISSMADKYGLKK
jgi:hypothetical protein